MFLFSEFSFSNLSMIITWTLTSTTKNYMMWADIMHSQYMMQPKPVMALLQLIIVISVVTITVLHCTRYFISVAIIPNCTALYQMFVSLSVGQRQLNFFAGVLVEQSSLSWCYAFACRIVSAQA